LVIDDVEVLLKRVVYFIIEELIKLFSAFLHLGVSLFVMHILICDDVGSSLLNDVESELPCVETNVDEFKA
jgi:hypothetical protein